MSSGFVGDSIGTLPGPRSLMLPLCEQVRRVGVLTALPGAFTSCQVILFAMVFGCGIVGMRGNIAALCGYLL